MWTARGKSDVHLKGFIDLNVPAKAIKKRSFGLVVRSSPLSLENSGSTPAKNIPGSDVLLAGMQRHFFVTRTVRARTSSHHVRTQQPSTQQRRATACNTGYRSFTHSETTKARYLTITRLILGPGLLRYQSSVTIFNMVAEIYFMTIFNMVGKVFWEISGFGIN